MKRPILTLGCCAVLLAGCPQDPLGAADETGSSGTTASPTTGPPPTTVDPGDGTTTMGAEGSTSGPDPDDDGTTETGPGPCTADRECDNGVFCDGEERCEDGACVPGEPVECADAVDCTIDSCDPDKDECVYKPSNERCGCAETCHFELGCGDHCQVSLCTVNQPYECGDCIDNDGDCLVDDQDPDCWGPCDNNEGGFNGNVPGQQNQSECNAMDCYFDNNSGSGNDECYWSHTCDPQEPTACVYDPAYDTPGTPLSCEELSEDQLPECDEYCGPLTPNGCDCFGCCELTLDDDTTVTVYLGTTDPETDEGTCALEVVDNPDLCHPCTQVPGCLNECEECELCLGETELPDECDEQECPKGLQPCGLPGQEPCPEGQACVTGCCVPEPQ